MKPVSPKCLACRKPNHGAYKRCYACRVAGRPIERPKYKDWSEAEKDQARAAARVYDANRRQRTRDEKAAANLILQNLEPDPADHFGNK